MRHTVNKPMRRTGRRSDPGASHVSSWVLRRLGAVPGLKVVAETRRPRRLTVRVAGGPRVAFDVHEERIVSEERARALAADAPRARAKTLVATTRLAPRARVALRNAGISWIERDTGRCHLSGPGMLVDVEIGPDPEGQVDTKRGSRRRKLPPSLLRDKSGLLAEALLIRPHQQPITLTDLAATAGLSRGLVSRLLSRLTSLAILAAHGRAPRKHWVLRDPGALLDLWSDEERAEPEEVTTINAWSRTPGELMDRLGRLGDAKLRYAVAGTAAANLHAPTLTVDPIPDIWVPANVPPAQVARLIGGELVESGANARLFQRSGDAALRYAQRLPATKRAGSGVSAVSPYRAYVEARRGAGRGPDVAAALRSALPLSLESTKPTADA
jgi:hypothetical protein